MNRSKKLSTLIFIVGTVFYSNVVQASAKQQRTLAVVTQELIRAVEKLTIDEGLIKNDVERNKAAQVKVDQLREELAQVLAIERLAACNQRINEDAKKLQDMLKETEKEIHDKTQGFIDLLGKGMDISENRIKVYDHMLEIIEEAKDALASSGRLV